MSTTDSRGSKRRRALQMAAVLVLLIAIPASASHRFEDVSSRDLGHAEISRIAEAGVTVGCNPPASDEFCPDRLVPRWQMAVFLDRIAGRSATATSVTTLRSAGSGLIGGTPVTVDLLSGGQGSAVGQTTVDGSVTVTSDGAGCPCEVEAFLYRVRDDRKVGASVYGQLPAAAGSAASAVTLALSGGLGQGSDRTEVYAVGVFVEGAPGNAKATGSINASWTPYDGG
jgi:hypothetical protein